MSSGDVMVSSGVENGAAASGGDDKKDVIYPKTFSGMPFGEVNHFVNADGNYLFSRYWKPEKEIKALVFHVHGYAEHCGRSKELAKKLMEIGVFSFAHDHYAHGESQGLRCHVMDYTILIRDIRQHIDLIRPEYPDLPIFLYGHSMGGGLSVLTAHERPNYFRGILLSAPYITPSPDTATPFKVFLAQVIASVAPKLRIGKLNSEFLSRDQKQIDEDMNDPLNDHDGLRAGFAMQFLAMSDKLKKILPSLDIPIFAAHSEADAICDIGGTKLLIEVCNSKDKTFKIYKDCMHMLEHETPEFVEEYFAEVLKWIKERI
uniref:monoglyceride lipase-like isoform X1 n=1 Tax=Styela clava TaxID=7725 RepID=UPI00193A83FD|nr:monoglyceride lipase-like isoform X1 [Styela clava]XP_039259194.1 monoglyceride lipase-like isoform X1 [Styela clava]